MQLPSLRKAFADRFGRPCTVVARAPGRVNLIGEHTDYNDGFVLPIATSQDAWVAVAPRSDKIACAFSREIGEQREWPLSAWRESKSPAWTSYIGGVGA